MAPNPDLMALVPVDAPRRLKKWSDGASFVVSAKRGTKVRAGESLESALVCVLPPGCRVTAVPFHDTARARLAVADPVAGWVSRKTVAEAAGPARGSDDAEARAALLRVMARVRRDVVGEGADGCPLDQCFTSSLALVEALQKRADIAAVLGEATMISGSYDAVGRAKGRPSWWPDDYVDWMPHSFVEFKDGTVVDVSADQFDVGQQKRAKFPTSKAPFSAVFYSFRLIFGRAIISRSGLEAWMLFWERARAEHSR